MRRGRKPHKRKGIEMVRHETVVSIAKPEEEAPTQFPITGIDPLVGLSQYLNVALAQANEKAGGTSDFFSAGLIAGLNYAQAMVAMYRQISQIEKAARS